MVFACMSLLFGIPVSDAQVVQPALAANVKAVESNTQVGVPGGGVTGL